ncbi:hypothetical protein F2P56_030689 [Juglans regia]|uniref:Gag-pol polyprotein n=2 Tax=Juglans regia TaxID=51240 RepID=A0A833U519_JUGRE|nr:uncharacterized protein LOC109003937 [Juglans regia]KAF5450328.1 hypothetical protein F2P56_030689 [Juglans regia]
MMCNGEFLQKDSDEAIEDLNEHAEKVHTWTEPSVTESTNRSQPARNPNGGGIYHLREEDSLKAKVEMLTKELDVLKTKDLKLTRMANHAETFGPYFVCGKSSHIPTIQDNSDAEGPKEPEVTKNPVKVPFTQALKSSKRTLDPNNEILENPRQRKDHVKKIAFLTEQVSALIEQRIPLKYNDPGCPTIACSIENHECGAPDPHLGLGEIKPTTVVLQLANRSVNVPRGVVEDVLIQIDKFYYPVDFLILDTSSVVDTMMGRYFLATANALIINCRNELMKLSFGNMILEVNIFHITKQPEDDDESHQTYMIDSLIDKGVSTVHDFDPLEYFLNNYEFDSISDLSDVVDICTIFYRTHDYGTQAWQPKFEDLPEKGEK